MKKTWYLWFVFILFAEISCGPEAWRADWADSSYWRFEIHEAEKSFVKVQGDTLEIASSGGATVWLDTLLRGDYVVRYDRIVLMDTGVYDRVSDLNQFWLADEHGRPGRIKTRSGEFSSYDDMDMFYVGIGGNYNTTTRFRRYNGQGERVLLGEKNEEPYLLKPNKWYRIETVVSVSKGYTALYVDGVLLFEYHGEIPDAGFFGIRSTYSRQRVTNWSISSK